MDLGARILVFLFFLTMIAGLSGRIGVCLILFAVIFVYAFIYVAILSDIGRRKEAIQDRMNQTPIRSIPAKIIRMRRKEEVSYDYYISFEGTEREKSLRSIKKSFRSYRRAMPES